MRFTKVIVSAAAYVRVSRLTVPLMRLLLLAATLLMIHPTLFYLENARLEEWMFYRFAFAGMLGTFVVTLLCATIVVEHATALALMRHERVRGHARGLWRYENLRFLVAGGVIAWMAGVFLNFHGVVELLTSGHVTLHWSRVLAGMFFSVNLAQLLGTLCAVKILRALHLRQPFLHGEPRGGGENR